MNYKEKYEKTLEVIKEILGSGEDTIKMSRLQSSLKGIFPEIKESEDEKVRNEIIAFIKKRDRSGCDYDYDQWIAWLEKQGEQNLPSVNERAWLYLVSDVLTWKDGIGQYLDDPRVQKLAKELCSEYAQKLYNNQEPVDKVEPKFHEGDWISGYYTNYRVTAINSKGYVVEDTDGNKINILFENEKFHHLFTIADAKDGDVLVDMHGNIGIFQECEDVFWHSYIYLGCDGTLRGFSIGGSHEQTDTHPATKEQRDILIKAMTDAGWEFDFEKKELKKLGQQEVTKISDQVKDSAWSKEDEKMLDNCINALGDSSFDTYEIEEWLKSFKQRIGG